MLNLDVKQGAADSFTSGFQLLPPGWTKFVMTKWSLIQNSDGDGNQFEVELQSNEGSTVKRWICFTRQAHDKQWQVEKGQAELIAIADACGFTGKLTTLDLLCGRPFEGLVSIKESKKINENTGKPYENNDVTKYRRIQQQQVPPQQHNQAQGWS